MTSASMASGPQNGSILKPAQNLDWTRDSPPHSILPYQMYIRDVDWSKTELGPMSCWRRELRQMVLFMMAETNPVILYWGEHRTMIYNEAYVPLVGRKHPELQGMNAPDAFPEFWSYFEQIIKEQSFTGETRYGEASMLLMERHGFLEETYFDWKLIPVIGDDGTMLGAYGRPTECSTEVIGSRRASCIHALTQHVSDVTSFDGLWGGTIAGLTQNAKDIPIAMIYTVERQDSAAGLSFGNATTCRLSALLGVPSGHTSAPETLNVQSKSEGIAPFVLSAIEKQTLLVLDLVESGLGDLFDGVEWRGFGDPVTSLAFVPIKERGKIAALLVVGLNPRLRFTSKYQEFVQMIGDVLAPQISRIRLAQEVDIVSAFQKSEMKFSRFAERSPLGLALTDVNGNVVYANESWYKFCGLKTETVGSVNWIETVYEDDLALVNEWWHKATHLGQSGTFQIRSKEPFVSGDIQLPYRTGICAFYPDLDENGHTSSVMGIITDISELKWTEEQLLVRQRQIEQSEEKYRDFAEHAPIGVVSTDATGYVLFANDAWRSFYNFDRDHVLTDPQPWLASLNKEDVPAASQFFQDLSTTGIPKSVEVRLRRRKSTKDANRATPTEFWLLATGFAEFNPDGSINNIVFWVTDISDQKAAEKVLTDKMEEAIRLKNTQERFVDMISHEIRNPLSAILHCGEEIVDAMKKCLTLMEKVPHRESTQIEQPDLVSMGRSIASALDAANTIMYCVQHQKQIVDDVLTLSKLDADLLVVSPIPVQPTELVRSALKIFEPELKASAIELAFEIDHSLQQLDVDWIMLDPNRFLQIIINLVTNAIKFTRNSATRRIVIEVTAQNDKPPPQHRGVHYVPQREVDKFADDNMLDNGIDRASAQDLYLCFRVEDTGKGLTESECATLFHRFAQASPKTHIEYGGSGLGLFISRQITEMLGGEIGVGSEPGKGATFAFYVRTRRVRPPRRASLGVESVSLYTKTLVTPTPGTWVPGHTGTEKKDPRPTLPTPEPTTHKRRVLVVEDNLVNQKVLCKQLRNRGFVVDATNHGREALDALEKVNKQDPSLHFDVILCDIEMPVMDGIQCVTEIRRLESTGIFRGHIPIIGVTANVRSKQVNAAVEAGMDGVTTKPYRIDELIAHIDRVSDDVKNSKKP